MDKVFIVAEAGVNHNGSLKLARKLVDAAVEAGADAVKFQTFTADSVVSKTTPKTEYQKKSTGIRETQWEMIKKLELNWDSHKKLMDYCQKKGIMFLSSPFDLKSIDLLNSLGLKIFKIPSGEITNLPLLRKIGSLKKTVILSTGMSTLKEITDALKVLVEAGTKKENIIVLHCNTEYPTPMQDVNLKAMLTIRNRLKVKVGYSDHTLGTEVTIAAVALGATIIEKHFTLDRNMEGPDHKASLNPQEFSLMVNSIRNIEKAMGSGEKVPSVSELKNKPIVRKSITASRDIKKGEIFTDNNITTKRPGTGISPMQWDKIIGKKVSKDFKKDDLIEL